MRVTLGAVLLFTAGSIVAQSAADSTLLARADTLLAHQDFKGAAKLFDKLIDGPLAAQGYTGRASCGKDLDGAMADLYQAITIDPTYCRARMVRAMLYQKVKMFDKAVADLDVAVANAIDTATLTEALCDRGWALTGMRKFDLAERDYRQVLAIDSNDARAVNNLGMALKETGHHDEAEQLLRRMIQLTPDEVEGYMNMAFFLSELGRHTEALNYFDQAEAHGAKHPFFYNNRGYAKLKTGDAKGALKDIERSIDLDPTNSYAFRNRALVHLELKDHDKACTDLETALKLRFTEQFGPEVKDLYEQHCH